MDITKVMTSEQKLKMFDEVVEQRDKLLYILGEIFDAMNSGHCNSWDISRHMTPAERETCEVPRLTDAPDVYLKKLSKCGYFHLYWLEKKINEFWPMLNVLVDKPELYSLLKTFKKPRVTEEDVAQTIPDFNWSDRMFAKMLMRFLLEYRFDKQYPGDEPYIYQDAFRAIVIAALQRIGISITDEDAIAKLIAEEDKENTDEK